MYRNRSRLAFAFVVLSSLAWCSPPLPASSSEDSSSAPCPETVPVCVTDLQSWNEALTRAETLLAQQERKLEQLQTSLLLSRNDSRAISRTVQEQLETIATLEASLERSAAELTTISASARRAVRRSALIGAGVGGVAALLVKAGLRLLLNV